MKITAPLSRIRFIDVLRGLALVAMTIYHFTWDLEFFGFVLAGTINEPAWVFFARSIASSFLFLTGVSLVLAHGDSIRWASFTKRFVLVAASAAIISVATWFAFPQSWIFFGILHAIALFSLLGLAFLRLPWWSIAIVAAAIIAIGQLWSAEVFDHPALLWVGLAPLPPQSNDYVPLFPWFAATLLGMAFAKLGRALGWMDRLAAWSLPQPVEKPLLFLGRHSLIYYLIHQPILLGLIWCFVQVAGPADRTANFVHLCTGQCVVTRDEPFCRTYCGCMADGLKQAKLFDPFLDGKVKMTSNIQVEDTKRMCVKKNEDQ